MRVIQVIVVVLSLHVAVRGAMVFLDDIEAHFEDIVCFIVVPETFFLLLCIDVTQLLRSFRMLNAHYAFGTIKIL